MSKLEDLLPELAGVFAAQESAMENVVSMLTTQVAQLIQDNDRQTKRVAALETTQQQLQSALLTLRKAYDALEDEHRSAKANHTDALSAVSTHVDALQQQLQQQVEATESKWQSVEARLDAAGAGPSESQVMDLVGSHLQSVESKLTAHVEHRLLETSHRSYVQAQQVEEAMKSDLEMLEKKFEYLSRVKMEIKDINRKVEKQDQTLDDMRMGLELLAKSIGTNDDESDNERDDHDGDQDDSDESRKPLRRVDKTEVRNVMKRISLSSADIQAKIDENAALLASAALASSQSEAATAREPERKHETAETHPVRSKSVSAASGRQAGFVRSKTLDIGAQAKTGDAVLVVTTSRSEGDIGEVGDSELSAIDVPVKSDASSDASGEETAAVEPSEVPSDALPLLADVAPPVDIEAPEDSIEAVEAENASTVEPETPSLTEEEPSAALEHDPVAPEQVQEQPPVSDAAADVQDVAPEQAPETEATTNGSSDNALEEAEEADLVVDILPSATSRSRLASREQPSFASLDDASESAGRPTYAPMQHVPSAPTVAMFYPSVTSATTSMIRSRKASRLLKRQGSVRKTESMDSSRSETRTPLARDVIKALWRRMFTRFVQLKRLQILSGANPDRIFRKQNMSVGARVKRLEETTADLEEMVDVLESNIQLNSQGIQALGQTFGQALAQSQADTDARVDKLRDATQAQGQMIVGVEEKLDLIELDLRRVRGSNRRDSSQAASSSAVSALTTQHYELVARVSEHASTLDAVAHSAKRLSELELPALSSKFETALHDLRTELEHKSREAAKDIHRSIEQLRELQSCAETRLLQRTNAFAERLYRDIMRLSKAHLAALEMTRSARTNHASPLAAVSMGTSSGGKKTRATLLDVSLEMLEHIFTSFQDDCRAAVEAQRLGRICSSNDSEARDGDEDDDSDASTRDVLLERATTFLDELERLKEQAARARASAVATFQSADSNSDATPSTSSSSASSSTSSSSSSFTDRLVLVTTAQLRALESLVSPERGRDRGRDREDTTAAVSDVSFQVQDLIVQLRAVLGLLLLHAELLDPHTRLELVLAAHSAIEKDVRDHGFALAQLGTVGASVKLMNTRLDAFLDLSYSFAKDDDVKKLIQDMLSSSDSVRDSLAQQLEATHTEAQRRDDMLERELTQLVARVNKKLDKDELLWTQEVIERQLQSVAKSSLGEDDLVDLHRLLRGKLDKSYFHALLLEQRHRAAAQSTGATSVGVYGSGAGSGSGSGAGGVPGNAPLIAAKCISCNSDVPPTKAMLQSVVKDQVALEVAKTLARQQPPGLALAAPASFQASTHRSMDKYKRELLAATTHGQQQQQQQQHKQPQQQQPQRQQPQQQQQGRK